MSKTLQIINDLLNQLDGTLTYPEEYGWIEDILDEKTNNDEKMTTPPPSSNKAYSDWNPPSSSNKAYTVHFKSDWNPPEYSKNMEYLRSKGVAAATKLQGRFISTTYFPTYGVAVTCTSGYRYTAIDGDPVISILVLASGWNVDDPFQLTVIGVTPKQQLRTIKVPFTCDITYLNGSILTKEQRCKVMQHVLCNYEPIHVAVFSINNNDKTLPLFIFESCGNSNDRIMLRVTSTAISDTLTPQIPSIWTINDFAWNTHLMLPIIYCSTILSSKQIEHDDNKLAPEVSTFGVYPYSQEKIQIDPNRINEVIQDIVGFYSRFVMENPHNNVFNISPNIYRDANKQEMIGSFVDK